MRLHTAIVTGLLVLSLIGGIANAKGSSTDAKAHIDAFQGFEFWAVFPRNIKMSDKEVECEENCYIVIDGAEGSVVTVDERQFVLPESGFLSIKMNKDDEITPPENANNLYVMDKDAAFLITSTKAVRVRLLHSPNSKSSGSTYVLPLRSLGTQYMATAFENTLTNEAFFETYNLFMQLTVIGTRDATRVKIGEKSFRLNKGETITQFIPNYLKSADAYEIKANRPVAVIQADSCLDTGPGACDMALTTLVPKRAGALNYTFPKLIDGLNMQAKCSILHDDTVVEINGSTPNKSYTKGQILHVRNLSGAHLKASRKIMCNMLLDGSSTLNLDPDYTVMPGKEHAVKKTFIVLDNNLATGLLLLTHPTKTTDNFKLVDTASEINIDVDWQEHEYDASSSYAVVDLSHQGKFKLTSASPFNSSFVGAQVISESYFITPGFSYR